MLKEKPVVATVEKAKPAELPIVIGIYRQHKVECDGISCNNTLVARNDVGGVVGASKIEKNGEEAHIRRLAVEKELQGKGIESQLVKGVIAELRKDGLRQ